MAKTIKITNNGQDLNKYLFRGIKMQVVGKCEHHLIYWNGDIIAINQDIETAKATALEYWTGVQPNALRLTENGISHENLAFIEI